MKTIFEKFFNRRRWSRLFVLIPLIIALNGCVYLIVGGIGAVGGYVVSPDTVEGVCGDNVDEVWHAATDIIAIMGTINEQQKEAGIIVAKIQNAKVIVTISKMSEGATRLRVKSRKAFLPKISISQEVFVKIMSQLKGS